MTFNTTLDPHYKTITLSLIGLDRNSGTGGIWAGTGSGRFGRYQTGTAFFSMLYYRFYMSYLHHVQSPDCITPSRALLQFPGCITCSPPVLRLYHVLPSSSQNVSCPPPPPPPLGDTWRGKSSLISPFVTFIRFY